MGHLFYNFYIVDSTRSLQARTVVRSPHPFSVTVALSYLSALSSYTTTKFVMASVISRRGFAIVTHRA